MIKLLRQYYETTVGKIVCMIALLLIAGLITLATYIVTSNMEGGRTEAATTEAFKLIGTEESTEEITTTPMMTEETTEEETTEEQTTEEITTEAETTTVPPVISMEDLDVSDGDKLGEDVEDIRNNVVVEDEPETETTTVPPTTTEKETKPKEEETTKEEITEEETQDEELLEDNKNVTAPTPTGTEYGCIAHGIDVSKYQGNIDWKKVKEAGYTFAIIRCGYRGYETGSLATDSKFEQNIKGAIENGIQVGIYFFSQAITEKEAQEEASLVINLIKEYNITYPVVFDWETSSDWRTDKGLSTDDMTKIATTYLSMVENAGYTGMLYGNKNDLLRFDIATLSKNYKVWFARYTTTYQYSDKYYIAGEATPETVCSYQMWQYKSTGKVPGISGNVDMNVAFFSYEGSGVPAAPLRIELTHESFEIRPGESVDLLNGVTAISSSAINVSDKVAYEIFDVKGNKVDKKNAVAVKGEYKVVYYINDFTGVTAKAEAKLIVGGEPKIELKNYNINYFVDSDCATVTEEQVADIVKSQLNTLLEDNLVKATDLEGNDLTAEVVYTEASDYSFAKGSYVYSYTVMDSKGYEGRVEFIVNLTSVSHKSMEASYEEMMEKVTEEYTLKDVILEYLQTNIESGNSQGIVVGFSEELTQAIENNTLKNRKAYKLKYTMEGIDETLYYKECELIFSSEESSEAAQETTTLSDTTTMAQETDSQSETTTTTE